MKSIKLLCVLLLVLLSGCQKEDVSCIKIPEDLIITLQEYNPSAKYIRLAGDVHYSDYGVYAMYYHEGRDTVKVGMFKVTDDFDITMLKSRVKDYFFYLEDYYVAGDPGYSGIINEWEF